MPPGQEHRWDNKKWFPLGDNLPDAYRTFADRVERNDSANTMSDLFERYLLEHSPTCRPKTQAHHRRAIGSLREVFGNVAPHEFQSEWAFRYYDERKKSGKHAADTDIKVLSHVFSMAVKWGVIKNGDHPLRGLKIKEKSAPRDRYVEDWELVELLKVADRMMTLYIALKLMTGMDKSTILSIRIEDLAPAGIITRRQKTKGKRLTYLWTDELKACIEAILQDLPRPMACQWLFVTRTGKPYINRDGYTSAFDSKWKRLMLKALNETDLQDRFHEHDLRAKAASDAESLDYAQALLDHNSSTITDRVYRRKRTVSARTINLEQLGIDYERH